MAKLEILAPFFDLDEPAVASDVRETLFYVDMFIDNTAS
jgi:hypothetical protein